MSGRRLIVVALIGLVLGAYLHAETHGVTLTGRLTGAEDASETGQFFFDADNLGTIAINTGETSYLSDYLAGTVGHRITMTIGPAEP